MDIGKYRERIKELQDYLLINNSTGYYPNICNELMEELNIVLNELEKKEAVINEMSNFINIMSNELVAETGYNNLEFCKMQKCIDNRELDCEDCIKEYFTKKVEGK